MVIKEVKYNDEIIARYIPSNSWSNGLGFYSDDSDFMQVGSWKYDKGKILLKHVHNPVIRTVIRTHEVLYVRKGSIRASIYSLDETFIEEIIVNEGDILILLNSGHGYEILQDDTEVLEIKNGPYLGAEIDRRRFNG